MIHKSSKLKPVAHVAGRQRDAAANRLRTAQEELNRYEQRLSDVQGFREEYQDRFHNRNTGMNARQMKDFRVFISKLDAAVQQMEDLVRDARTNCNSHKDAWVERRARFLAIEGVIERYRFQEQRDELRRDERESDDRNNQR